MDATGDQARIAEQMARQASSFGTQAAAYAEHRPDYAEAAVRWAMEPVRGRDPVRVLDIGAGTGKLTGVIARLALASPPAISLVTVEPDPAMLAELRRLLPELTGSPPAPHPGSPAPGNSPSAPAGGSPAPGNSPSAPAGGAPGPANSPPVPGSGSSEPDREPFVITTMAGDAEHIPLPDGSVDVVLAGQAAHWFNMELAAPEIARVLTPGGVFAGLWNYDDDSVEWVAGLAQVCQASRTLTEWRTDQLSSTWPGAPPSAAAGPPASALFRTPEEAGFEHGQLRTAASLVATIATHSRQLVMDPGEREQVLARVRAYLDSRPETSSGEFRVPMRTMVVRSERI